MNGEVLTVPARDVECWDVTDEGLVVITVHRSLSPDVYVCVVTQRCDLVWRCSAEHGDYQDAERSGPSYMRRYDDPETLVRVARGWPFVPLERWRPGVAGCGEPKDPIIAKGRP